MSLRIFFKKLQEEDLTLERLEKAWNETNLTNKSYLIDVAKNSFLKKLDAFKEEGIHSIPKDEVVSLCEKFRYRIVLMKMDKKKIEPMLEDKHIGSKTYKMDTPTSLLFEELDGKLVATHVFVQGTVHKLRTKHLDICLSKGWYFQSDIPEYATCPLRLENTSNN